MKFKGEISHPARDANIVSVSEEFHEIESDFVDGVSLFSQRQFASGEIGTIGFWKPGTWKGHGRYYTPGCRTVYDRLYLHIFHVNSSVSASVSMPNVGVHLDGDDAIEYKQVVCLPDGKLKIKEDKI